MRKSQLKKDIHIQIDKPTYRETPMKSKTQHIDAGGWNTRVHMEMSENIGLAKHRRFQ